ANRLGVDCFGGLGHKGWPLFEALVEMSRLDARLTPPADCASVDVVDVENLRPAVNDPLLDRIAEVTPGDRSRRVPEVVGAIGFRLVEPPEGLLLELQAVHKGLAAVIDGAVSGTVGAGERVDLVDELSRGVGVAVLFI